MKYVIIGNSAAAIGAVEGIRQIDAASPIVLISKEPHHTYSRPLISYLLWGKTDERRMKYRPDDFYEVNHVQALLGRRDTIGQMHGRVISDARCGRPLFALYHPASVIYNPSLREVYLYDLDTLKEVLRMERPVGQLDAPRA